MSINVEDTRYIDICSQHGTSVPASTGYATSYLSNMTFSFRGLLTESDEVRFSYVDIVNAQIPVSFYNVSATCNALNYSMAGGATQTLTLTPSNYTSTSLMAALTAGFLVAGVSMTLSLNRASGCITFSCATAFAFLASGSSIFDLLGFAVGAGYASSAGVLAAPFPLCLLGIKQLKFGSTALATNSVSSFGGSATALFATIPVNAGAFGVIQYTNPGSRKSLLRARTIDDIDIQIYDENNALVNFNNSDWSITLAITTTRQVAIPDGKKLTDVATPIMTPMAAAGQTPEVSAFGAESDLDFFMYQMGIDI